MQRQSVQSTAIASVGWDKGVLEVEFLRGGTYRYVGYSKQEYEEILSSGSVGHAVNCQILNRCGTK